MKIHQIAYHRNGTSGNGFNVVLFTEGRGDDKRNMIAVVFAEPGNIAIFDAGYLGGLVIGYPNRFRAEDFEPEIRAALAEREVDANAENERKIAELEAK